MRVSQFICFLNQQKVGKDALPQYSHITIEENLRITRRLYRRNAKQESKRKEKEQEEKNGRNKTTKKE